MIVISVKILGLLLCYFCPSQFAYFGVLCIRADQWSLHPLSSIPYGLVLFKVIDQWEKRLVGSGSIRQVSLLAIHAEIFKQISSGPILWMQVWCVPDRCVPDRKFLDVAPLEQSVPWLLCPWPMCPNPGPRQAWTAQRMDYILGNNCWFQMTKTGFAEQSSFRSLTGWGLNRFVWKFQHEQLKSRPIE